MEGPARGLPYPLGDIDQPVRDMVDRHQIQAGVGLGRQDADPALHHQAAQGV